MYKNLLTFTSDVNSLQDAILSDAVRGWAGWALAQPGSSVNPTATRGQIMPATLLLAHPDLKT
jgi:hypothetical protein